MSSSSFQPLADERAVAVREFRPLVSVGRPVRVVEPAPVGTVTAEPVLEAGLVEPGDELRRAYQSGYEAARAELGSQVETPIAESFVKAIEELGAFRARLRDRYERELLEVALGVARRIVQQELTERPEMWLTMLRAAVRRVVDRERIVVRVPAALAAFLRERTPELRATLDDVREVSVVEDPGLPPTGCLVESRMGDVDLGVDSQLEAAHAALLRTDD